MPRVIGIDPGTISIDLCGLDEGRVFLDESLPTADALGDPAAFVARLEAAHPDLVAAPSGYGLPCIAGRDLTETDLRLAYLAAEGESGGIKGLRGIVRALARSSLPVVFTPGVIHLPTVPEHRKVNRVDMGTADKVCAAVLAVRDQASRRGCRFDETAFVLLELGGAFSAAVAVESGRIVDGVGGSSGPLGLRAPGAIDGEVAYLAGTFSKSMIFHGGAAAVAGLPDADAESVAGARSPKALTAWYAYVESAVKAVAALWVSAPGATEVVLSGRVSRLHALREELAQRLVSIRARTTVMTLEGFASPAKQGAQGAALLADGLAGGASRELVDTLRIRDARGTVLDHLYVIPREMAKKRLGIV